MKTIKKFEEYLVNEKINTVFLKKVNTKDLKSINQYLDLNKLTDADFVKISDTNVLSKKPYNIWDEYIILIFGDVTDSNYDSTKKEYIHTKEYKLKYVIQGANVSPYNISYRKGRDETITRKALIEMTNNNSQYDVYAIKYDENSKNRGELRNTRNNRNSGVLINPNSKSGYNDGMTNRDKFNIDIKNKNLDRYAQQMISKADYDNIIDLFEEKYDKYNRKFNINSHKLRYAYKDENDMKAFKTDDNTVSKEIKDEVESIIKGMKYAWDLDIKKYTSINLFIEKLFKYFVERLKDTKDQENKNSIEAIEKILILL